MSIATTGTKLNCIEGPSVVVFGWIPYYSDIGEVKAEAYTGHPLTYCFDLLFYSGNREPDLHRDQGPMEVTYEQYVKTKDFRGALYLREVRLCSDESGAPVELTFEEGEDVGYTPLRNFLVPRRLRSKRVYFHEKGIGGGGHEVEFTESGAIIRKWVRFRIGKPGNFAGWLLTGKWAPNAWMMVEYTTKTSGSVEIAFDGSFIPSHRYLINERPQAAHDMMNNTRAQIDGFIDAGADVDAPGIVHKTLIEAAASATPAK